MLTLIIPKIKEEVVDIEAHIWITGRAKMCPVRQMSTTHIRSCIKCWNGEGNLRIPKGYLGGKEKWLKIFEQELLNRQ